MDVWIVFDGVCIQLLQSVSSNYVHFFRNKDHDLTYDFGDKPLSWSFIFPVQIKQVYQITSLFYCKINLFGTYEQLIEETMFSQCLLKTFKTQWFAHGVLWLVLLLSILLHFGNCVISHLFDLSLILYNDLFCKCCNKPTYYSECVVFRLCENPNKHLLYQDIRKQDLFMNWIPFNLQCLTVFHYRTIIRCFRYSRNEGMTSRQ